VPVREDRTAKALLSESFYMRLNILLAGVILALGVSASPYALAARVCEGSGANSEAAVKAHQMAALVSAALQGDGDDLVLISLAAQDLSQFGLDFSHMGFAIRSGTAWRVVHSLNTCAGTVATLSDDSLEDFFSDQPHQYKASLVRLGPNLQRRLMNILAGKAPKRLHESQFSLAAYPFSTRYQNSSGWALEILALALAPPSEELATREEAQEWLKKVGYPPTQLSVGILTRLGARLSRTNVNFDDHPPALRWSNQIQTSTPASVIAFLASQPKACVLNGCKPLVVALPPQGPPLAPRETVQTLRIRPQNASTFADNATPPYVAVGDSNQLEVDVTPAEAHMKLEWHSSNPSVAIVDKFSGLVVGIAPGTAEMSVTDTVTQTRSEPLPFTTMADIKVGDLVWKITSLTATFNNAQAFCKSKGWRLPTLTEAHAVRMGSAYTGNPQDAFEGPFDSWRFVSEFRTSTNGGDHQHADWFWDQRGGPIRPIDIPDAVRSHVLCVQPISTP
jgi:hypothetical protein